MSAKDMTGQKFHRLTILSRVENDKHGNAVWLCRCDCGVEKTVMGAPIRSGKTTSCGCTNREIVRAQKTHGASGTKNYKAWFGMLQRCGNPNHAKWHRYGARGISVCDRWKSYENFLEDMGERPEGMTLDRENNDGNYEPGNCRWASQMTQGNNRGNNRIFEIDGKNLTLSEASRAYGIHKDVARSRLSSGWGVDEAFKTPLANQKEITC